MLNIGMEVVQIVSQRNRSAEADGTDGSAAYATQWNVTASKRAPQHGLWGGPSVSGSRSAHRHDLAK